MESWRFRFMVLVALVILIFGDFLGYGGGGERKLQVSRQSPTMRNNQPVLFLDNEEAANEFLYMSTIAGDGELASKRVKMTAELRDACLPKILCEIGTKQQHQMTVREASLMELIESTTMTLMGFHTKWHFAAHMGYLMRHLPDAGGCAMLWPQCPFSSTRMQELNKRVHLRV